MAGHAPVSCFTAAKADTGTAYKTYLVDFHKVLCRQIVGEIEG